jgi:phosphoglycolate phosphatase
VIDAILFDLDMTLVDTREDIAASANEVRRQYGLDPLPEATVASFIGGGVENLLARALGDAFRDREADSVERFRAHYRLHCLDRSYVYEGLREVLASWAHVKLGVVSNKPERFCEQIIEGFGLRRFFGVIVGGDTAPHLKPHADPILHACNVLGVSPNTTVMVGDSVGDIHAARAAGCRVIAVTYGLGSREKLEAEHPDAIASRSGEISRILQSWSASRARWSGGEGD